MTWATPESRVARARSMVGRGVYGLGAGGKDPVAPTPFIAGKCDCSGFVAWVVGYPRRAGLDHAEWINTDSMILDATKFCDLYVVVPQGSYQEGDVVVYPGIDLNRDGARDRIGHCGVIVKADPSSIRKSRVVHCQARKSPAVVETDGAIFTGRAQFRGRTDKRWAARVLRPVTRPG